MIGKVSRGDRMAGLMTYLVGPGRSNEHTEPHLVAGDPALMAWYDDNELSAENGYAIARHLDRPRTAFSVEVKGGHVWHCSLSIRAEEGELADEKWQAIAQDFITAMDMDDADGVKAPVRWAAVHHGLSSNGNDHIHLVVNLVREDGTKVSVNDDFKRAKAACRALEVRHGLERLETSRDGVSATRGYTRAEVEAEARRMAVRAYRKETQHAGSEAPEWNRLPREDRERRVAACRPTARPRVALALRVRAAATASASEAEFVRRMRRNGLMVRPRFAEGRTDVVTGFSVAARPESPGERPIFYGGGTLAHDLTLSRLRGRWSDSPEAAAHAADEWNAARRNRRAVRPGREMSEFDPAEWRRHQQGLSRLVKNLHAVPLHDRHTWATVARESAGVLASWSLAREGQPGDLAAASTALSQSAQTYRRAPRPERIGTESFTGMAMLMASVAKGGQGRVAEAVLIREMLRLVQAVHEAEKAAEHARHARHLAQTTRAQLVRVREALPTPVEAPAAHGAAEHQEGAVATLERPVAVRDTTELSDEAKAMLARIDAAHASNRGPGSPIPTRLPDGPTRTIRETAKTAHETTPER